MTNSEFLNAYLITFNCGRELINPAAFAPHLLDALQKTSRHDSTPTIGDANASKLPDLIVLNLQEVAPIAYSFLGGSYLAPYFDRFTKLVELAGQSMQTNGVDRAQSTGEIEGDSRYVNIITRNLGLTAIMIFVRSDMISQIDGVMTAGVGVGVHETGNKGAVGVRIGWRLGESASNTTAGDEILNLTFVSAHLAPMEEELQRRHQDFQNITKGLVFTSDTKTYSSSSTLKTTTDGEDNTAEAAPLLSGSSDGDVETSTAKPASSGSLIGMYSGPTHLFFAGDLNYRTSSSPPSTEDVSSFPKLDVDPSHANHYSQLLKRDQLNIARKNNETLHGLTEEAIHFAPTYKYKYRIGGNEANNSHVIEESDTKSWEWASHRWPSWCDRILFFQPTETECQVKAHEYTSLPMITTSDHRPVALSVSIPLVPLSQQAKRQLASSSPVPKLDPNWHSRRNIARRREIVVGLASYIALTREGNALALGSLVALFGGIVVLRNIGF